MTLTLTPPRVGEKPTQIGEPIVTSRLSSSGFVHSVTLAVGDGSKVAVRGMLFLLVKRFVTGQSLGSGGAGESGDLVDSRGWLNVSDGDRVDQSVNILGGYM